jgi:hypothetical protein
MTNDLTKPIPTGVSSAQDIADFVNTARALPQRPTRSGRRLAIIVEGELRDLERVREMAGELQESLPRHTKGAPLQIKLGWFLDNKSYMTTWGTNPRNIADETSRAHCVRGQTRFANIFSGLITENNVLNETCKGDKIDGIIVIGSQMNEAPETISPLIKKLRAQRTEIFTLQVGSDQAVTAAFSEWAKETGGVHMPVDGVQDLQNVTPVIAAHVFGHEELVALSLRDGPTKPEQRLAQLIFEKPSPERTG